MKRKGKKKDVLAHQAAAAMTISVKSDGSGSSSGRGGHRGVGVASITGSTTCTLDSFAAKADRALRNNEDFKRLVSSTKLIGREREVATLKLAIESVTESTAAFISSSSVSSSSSNSSDKKSGNRKSSSNRGGKIHKRPRVFSITGAAGTGKSSLVKDALDSIQHCQGYVCWGKYSRNGGESGLARCMKDLVHKIVDRDLDMGIRRKLQETISSSDAAVLIESFPTLSLLFDASNNSTSSDSGVHRTTTRSMETLDQSTDLDRVRRAKRRQFLFLHLIETLATYRSNQYRDEDIEDGHLQQDSNDEEKPQTLVMIVDDLQWVDGPSMELISALVRDPDLEDFLLVSTSRPPGDTIDPFRKELNRWSKLGVSMEEMHLENLEGDAINELVAHLLDTDPESTAPLGHILYEKTNGNPFFTTQFLKRLVEEQELVKYSFGDLQWNFDIRRIQSTPDFANANDAVALVQRRLRGLPMHFQILLLVASCVGASFDEKLLGSIVGNIDASSILDGVGTQVEEANLTDFLRVCIDFGVLESSGNVYFFSHDLVKEAASGFGDEHQNVLLKMRVGNCIIQTQATRATGDTDPMLFLGVDLCNRAISFLNPDDIFEWINLARYNHLAAQKATQSASFALAVHYADTGVKYLDEHDNGSEEHSALKLLLLTSATEAALCAEGYEKMASFASRVLAVKDCPRDLRLHMMYFQILSETALARRQEALDIGCKAIQLMGLTKLPRNPSIVSIVIELMKTKRLLKGHNKVTLSNLPVLTDERRVAGMRFVEALQTPAYIVNYNFLVVSFLRSFRWSIKYGITRYSPALFGIWSSMCITLFGDFSASAMYSEIALYLAERLDIRETTARTSLMCFGVTQHWHSEMRSCYQPIAYAHKLSMEGGDTETGLQCLTFMDLTAWCCTMFSLQQLGRDLCNHWRLCCEYKHEASTFAIYGFAKCLSRLCSADDPAFAWLQSPATGGEVNKPEDPAIEAFFDLAKMESHYILGEKIDTLECAMRTGVVGTKVLQGQVYVTRCFCLRGLVFLNEACDGNSSRSNLREAKKIIATMKRWVDGGNVNCEHLVHLLEAELARAKGKTEAAKERYVQAIQIARQTGHIQDAGITHECAAVFYLSCDDKSRAAHHIEQAEHAFRLWGASAKVLQLHEKYNALLIKHGSTMSTVLRTE